MRVSRTAVPVQRGILNIVMRSPFFIYASAGDLNRIRIYEIIFIRFNLILLEHRDK